MFRYSEAQKTKAIEMFMKDGPKKTRAEFGVSSTTLYRWMKDRGINWKEADNSPLLLPVIEEPSDTFDAQDIAEENTQDNTYDDDKALISALLNKIESLQSMNNQLRKALRVLLE